MSSNGDDGGCADNDDDGNNSANGEFVIRAVKVSKKEAAPGERGRERVREVLLKQ